MARVIVLGAGTGGMAGAYEIREILSKQHKVTVINDREDFQFCTFQSLDRRWLA